MWPHMAAAEVDILLKIIQEPSCVTLQQSLEIDTVKAVDPDDDVPSGHEVLSYQSVKHRGQSQKTA